MAGREVLHSYFFIFRNFESRGYVRLIQIMLVIVKVVVKYVVTI